MITTINLEYNETYEKAIAILMLCLQFYTEVSQTCAYREGGKEGLWGFRINKVRGIDHIVLVRRGPVRN